MMCVFMLFDEYTDAENADFAHKLAEIVMDGMRRPGVTRPEGEHYLGEVVRQ